MAATWSANDKGRSQKKNLGRAGRSGLVIARSVSGRGLTPVVRVSYTDLTGDFHSVCQRNRCFNIFVHTRVGPSVPSDQDLHFRSVAVGYAPIYFGYFWGVSYSHLTSRLRRSCRCDRLPGRRHVRSRRYVRDIGPVRNLAGGGLSNIDAGVI